MTAIVSRGRHDQGGWKLEKVVLRELRNDELLIRTVASGICHTDIMFGNSPVKIGGWPRVMGHEGVGYVQEIGKSVESVAVGDPVLLSFASCRACRLCLNGHTSHCINAGELNFFGKKTFASEANPAQFDILGSFFGQSSFASVSIAHISSVVNLKGLVESEEELRMLAPLGCGLQTGCGTVMNVANAKPQDTIAIIGAGGVGLAAVMGAKLAGCTEAIIIIDRVQERLDLAKELGATHAVNTSTLKDGELIDVVRGITDGYGPSITIDATGVPALIEQGLAFTARRGQYIQVGSSREDTKLQIAVQDFMTSGKRFIGAVEGQVIPQEYVPKMIQWYKSGLFPFDKFVKQYAAKDFQDAIHAMETGIVIKPIIVW